MISPPGETLQWPTVRVLRYRQHKRDGVVIQAEWLTNFSLRKLGSMSFYRIAKSRWEIENQGFNDGKNRYGMEHICHHQPNSILIVWLLTALALVIERLYRLRYLHRGDHGIRSAMDLFTYLWLNPAPCGRLATLRCSFDNSTALPWRITPARSPPSLRRPQRHRLPLASSPLHCTYSCPAQLPRPLTVSSSDWLSSIKCVSWLVAPA